MGNNVIEILLSTYHEWIHFEDSTLEYRRDKTEIVKFETDPVFMLEELLIRLESCLILIPEYEIQEDQSLTPNFRKIATLESIKKSIFMVIKIWLRIEPEVWANGDTNEGQLTDMINSKLKPYLNLLSKQELQFLHSINETANSLKSDSYEDKIICIGYFDYESNILNQPGKGIK